MKTVNLEKLLAPADVAELLGVTAHTLAVWRCARRHGLAYVKVGRKVRYRGEDVEAFIGRGVVRQST